MQSDRKPLERGYPIDPNGSAGFTKVHLVRALSGFIGGALGLSLA